MYTVTNYRTGKAVKEAVKNGERVRVYQLNEMFPHNPNGIVTLEGPHYPEPHRWYLRVEITNDVVTKILK